MPQKKILFIINPMAGTERVKLLQKDIEAYLDSSVFAYDWVYTQYAKHGIALAQNAVRDHYDIVVAVGGDGSVNDVVNGLYGTSTLLGIIPKGSGNGLARSLQIPLQQKKAIQNLNRLRVVDIDVGKADGHLFVSNAGVGFDTVVTDLFQSSTQRGFQTYLQIILKQVWRYPSKKWQVTVDGEKYKTTSFMLTAANAQQLGYNFIIAKDADLSDGYFNFINMRKFPSSLAATIGLRAFMGKLDSSRFVSQKLAKRIVIAHPELKLLQIDGETRPCQSEILIEMMPKKLRVLAGTNF